MASSFEDSPASGISMSDPLGKHTCLLYKRLNDLHVCVIEQCYWWCPVSRIAAYFFLDSVMCEMSTTLTLLKCFTLLKSVSLFMLVFNDWKVRVKGNKCNSTHTQFIQHTYFVPVVTVKAQGFLILSFSLSLLSFLIHSVFLVPLRVFLEPRLLRQLCCVVCLSLFTHSFSRLFPITPDFLSSLRLDLPECVSGRWVRNEWLPSAVGNS